MSEERKIHCYRSGPIERDPDSSFHARNILDPALRELGIEIIGDSFEFLNSRGYPQTVYGSLLKKLRNQGRFYEYNQQEILVKISLRKVKQADFIIVKPGAEASGGTTAEITRSWFSGIPKLVIIGAHEENLLDNNSTFVIRMITDRFSLIFNTEKEVIDFIKRHLKIFKTGRQAIRQFILEIKEANPYFNDRLKPFYNKKFDEKTVIILGIAGAGKGTQAHLLQDLAGFKYFGSGRELRKLANKFPVLKEALGKGHLAPEIIINHLLTENLFRLEKFEPIVFDGSPRKLTEAKALMELLDILERKPEIIVLDIDEALAKERMVLRRNCDYCEISFCDPEIVKNPICHECGNSLSIRLENTTDEAINRILSWHKTDVEAVIRFFEEKKLVTRIDGKQSKKKIFFDILSILNNPA